MADPKAFYSYLENEDKLNILSDAQAGRLYKSLFAYARTGEKPDLSDDPLVAYAFADFVIDVDRDFESYADMCEKRAEAGRKGGAPKGNQNASKNKQNKQEVDSNKQKQAKTSKTSETEAEAEAEIIEKEIPKEKENRPEKDFDDVAFEVISEFNRLCLDLPEVTKLTDHRRRLLFNDGMMDKKVAEYTDLFKRVQKSDYLCGRSGSWRADFDWIIKNSVKITEGSYDNVEPKGKPPNKGGRMFSEEGASFDMDKWSGNVPEGCG